MKIGLLQILRSSGSLRIKFIKLADFFLGGALALMLPAAKTSRPDPAKISRIIIIRPGGIGDTVFLLPILKLLKSLHPDWEIDILCEKRNREVFESQRHLVNSIYCYDQIHPSSYFKKRYDAAIDTEQWHYLSGWIAHSLKAPLCIGFATRPLREKFFTYSVEYKIDEYELHNFKTLFETIEPAVKEINELGKCYEVVPEDRAWAANEIRSATVALFIGASVPEKRLVPGQILAIIKYFSEQNLATILLGGKDVLSTSQGIEEVLVPQRLRSYVGKIPLRKSVALIQQCKYFIGPDSGLLHLACAVGTSVIALWGPSNIKKWSPRGKSDLVVTLNAECSPCAAFGYSVPTCRGSYHCMRDITIEHIKQKMEQKRHDL